MKERLSVMRPKRRKACQSIRGLLFSYLPVPVLQSVKEITHRSFTHLEAIGNKEFVSGP